jgi:hypothetical protein
LQNAKVDLASLATWSTSMQAGYFDSFYCTFGCCVEQLLGIFGGDSPFEAFHLCGSGVGLGMTLNCSDEAGVSPLVKPDGEAWLT